MGISDQWVAFFHAVILDPKFSHPIALHCNQLSTGRRTKEGIEGMYRLFKCLGLEMTPITSTYILYLRASYMATFNCKGAWEI